MAHNLPLRQSSYWIIIFIQSGWTRSIQWESSKITVVHSQHIFEEYTWPEQGVGAAITYWSHERGFQSLLIGKVTWPPWAIKNSHLECCPAVACAFTGLTSQKSLLASQQQTNLIQTSFCLKKTSLLKHVAVGDPWTQLSTDDSSIGTICSGVPLENILKNVPQRVLGNSQLLANGSSIWLINYTYNLWISCPSGELQSGHCRGIQKFICFSRNLMLALQGTTELDSVLQSELLSFSLPKSVNKRYRSHNARPSPVRSHFMVQDYCCF